MCVIMIVEDKRPSTKQIDDAFNRNMDGGGVAWRTGTGKDAEVHWRKGLTRAEMHKLLAELPLPFIAHFRLKSIGKVLPILCHPFPIDRACSTALEGKTKSFLWFHNGTWHTWNDFLMNIAAKTGAKLPVGKWNDTRAMAWLASVVGLGFLDVIEARGVAYGPSEHVVFEGPGWIQDEGIWMANDLHIPKAPTVVHYGGNYGSHHERGTINRAALPAPSTVARGDAPKTLRIYCVYDKCTNKDIDAEGYCGEHRKKNSLTPQTTPTTTAATCEKGVRPSPFKEQVDRVREVARTQGPFLAAEILADLQLSKGISKSQAKLLTQELGRMKKKHPQVGA